MSLERCEVCGRVAKFHETVIAGGVATASHRCTLHGAAAWRRAVAAAETPIGPGREAAFEALRRAIGGRDLGR